jgi:hypothetical protein
MSTKIKEAMIRGWHMMWFAWHRSSADAHRRGLEHCWWGMYDHRSRVEQMPPAIERDALAAVLLKLECETSAVFPVSQAQPQARKKMDTHPEKTNV